MLSCDKTTIKHKKRKRWNNTETQNWHQKRENQSAAGSRPDVLLHNAHALSLSHTHTHRLSLLHLKTWFKAQMKEMTVRVTELERAQVSLSNLLWAQLCCLTLDVSVDDNEVALHSLPTSAQLLTRRERKTKYSQYLSDRTNGREGGKGWRGRWRAVTRWCEEEAGALSVHRASAAQLYCLIHGAVKSARTANRSYSYRNII